MGNRNWFLLGYKNKLHSVVTAAKISNFFQQIPRQFLEVLGLLSIGLLYFFLTSKGSSPAEVIAILGVFIIAAFRIIPSATRILASAQSISYARPAYNGLLEILNVGSSNGGTEKQFCELVSNSQLGYGFEYDSIKTSDRSTRNTIVLHKNKLNIIFGLSGSGKSTLLNSISNAMLSKQIGVSLLPQKSTLFHGSFIDNIFLHDENISIDKIDKKYFDSLLTVLKLTELAERFKNEEFIDEESTNLSGGEARRICLLRHLIRSPEVLLLDEPTTGLSSEAEAEIFALLSQLAKDRTIVVVTHSKLAMEFGDQYISL
jgi:ABC-type transport system involved in cytochrome bd biosynthesis fused ATPase/permease subunit